MDQQDERKKNISNASHKHAFGRECLPLESLKMYGLLQLFFLPVLDGGKISFQ